MKSLPTIALIPARRGSIGIKNKNIINLKNKPLIEYSFIKAIKSKLIDKIYLSSDGFQDQFGGENDKKFLSKNFKKLIEDISEKSMSEQIKDLENAFRSWKKNTPQTDDVVVIGVEV